MPIAEKIVEGLALGFGGGGSPIVAVSGIHYSLWPSCRLARSSVRVFAQTMGKPLAKLGGTIKVRFGRP